MSFFFFARRSFAGGRFGNGGWGWMEGLLVSKAARDFW